MKKAFEYIFQPFICLVDGISYLFSDDVFTREDVHWWTIMLCRARNHPFKQDCSASMDGLEPIYNCSNCGEDFS